MASKTPSGVGQIPPFLRPLRRTPRQGGAGKALGGEKRENILKKIDPSGIQLGGAHKKICGEDVEKEKAQERGPPFGVVADGKTEIDQKRQKTQGKETREAAVEERTHLLGD